MTANAPATRRTRRLTLPAIGVLLGAALLLWLAGDFLLLMFASVLLAVVLDTAAEAVARRTPLSRSVALLLLVLLLLVATVLSGLVLAPQVADQFERLWQQINQMVSQLRQLTSRYGWLDTLFAGGQEGGRTGGPVKVAGQIASATFVVLDVVSSLVVMLVVALFLAARPEMYRKGLLLLVPRQHRDRTAEVLKALAHTLRWWMLGQMVSMTTLGVLTSIFLSLLGVDLWFALALLTALFTFVPFLGPIAASVPVLMVSLGEGLKTAMYVMLLYVAMQSFEGYWLTPMVQQRAVRLPPALLIAMQVLLGTLFGLLGLILAAPLTAAGMVLVQMVYLEGVLGEDLSGARR